MRNYFHKFDKIIQLDKKVKRIIMEEEIFFNKFGFLLGCVGLTKFWCWLWVRGVFFNGVGISVYDA